jgi:branched-chain amino acid transport system ATP-binding protein
VSALLEVAGLSVAYGRIEAVRGVDLAVGDGEFVGVIGSNGAGKTSLMRALAGVVRPAAGRVRFAGADVTALPSHRMVAAGFALVPEGRQVFADQTVEDNLLLGAYHRIGRDRAGVGEDLAERRGQLAGTLSGGEQQMLAIGRSLLARPRLLAIDELSLGLAPRVLEQLFPVLTALNRDGLSILLVEQMASYALAVTARTYVMEQGRVLLEGRSADLARDPRVLSAYLGRHAAAH